MRKSFINSVFVLFVFVALSGCRTYGDYGSEQASYDQIMEMNARFAQGLERAKAELSGIEQAAASDRSLGEAVEQYKGLLEKHEALIKDHEELAGTLTVKTGALGRLSSSYRDLNRALGYISASQIEMNNSYQSFAFNLVEEADRAGFEAEMGRYYVAPAFYEQIRHALSRRSVSDALNVRAGA